MLVKISCDACAGVGTVYCENNLSWTCSQCSGNGVVERPGPVEVWSGSLTHNYNIGETSEGGGIFDYDLANALSEFGPGRYVITKVS